MSDKFRLLIAQMTSTNRHEGNIAAARALVEIAAKSGCDLVALPEAAGMMNRDRDDALYRTTPERADPFVAECRRLSVEFDIWIHVGSTPIRERGKLLNHSVLLDSSGVVRARYDKIHLFDIFLDGKPAARESDRYEPGSVGVVVDTPFGTWGLSICYDLRFPYLYRDYARSGATVMLAPSAFTVPTGQAHWEPLLRARAIENGSWFVAAAQVGNHDDGRVTYGHSMVVDPWGQVVTDLGGEGPGHAVVEIDPARSTSARRQVPSIQHDRPYTLRHVREP